MKLGKFTYKTRNGTIVDGERVHHHYIFSGRINGKWHSWFNKRKLAAPEDEGNVPLSSMTVEDSGMDLMEII